MSTTTAASPLEPEAADPPASPWHAVDAEDVIARFHTHAEHGLSDTRVLELQQRFGPNVLRVEGRTRWYVVAARQYQSALILVLAAAALVSLTLGATVDAIAIISIIVLNGLLGFVQEWRAESALAALQAMLSPRCKVFRAGKTERLQFSISAHADRRFGRLQQSLLVAGLESEPPAADRRRLHTVPATRTSHRPARLDGLDHHGCRGRTDLRRRRDAEVAAVARRGSPGHLKDTPTRIKAWTTSTTNLTKRADSSSTT